MDHLTRDLYEAKLVYYSDTYENKVRTFCMNPGGEVSQEYYEGGIAVVNGHSYEDPTKRTGNTNFAMLVSTQFTEPFNQPIEYGLSLIHISEPTRQAEISYAVFCLKKKKKKYTIL